MNVYRKLISDLMSDYDKNIVPLQNDGPLNVTISYHLMTLVDIVSLETCTQVLKQADTQLAQYVLNEYKQWNDPRLRWNPAEWAKTDEDDVSVTATEHIFISRRWTSGYRLQPCTAPSTTTRFSKTTNALCSWATAIFVAKDSG